MKQRKNYIRLNFADERQAAIFYKTTEDLRTALDKCFNQTITAEQAIANLVYGAMEEVNTMQQVKGADEKPRLILPH